jgi:hypothetical protein
MPGKDEEIFAKFFMLNKRSKLFGREPFADKIYRLVITVPPENKTH